MMEITQKNSVPLTMTPSIRHGLGQSARSMTTVCADGSVHVSLAQRSQISAPMKKYRFFPSFTSSMKRLNEIEFEFIALILHG